MRKLIYYVAVSIDGFIAAPDGRTDFFLADGDHIPWLIETYPETIPGHVRGAFDLEDTPPRVFDTVLMGRSTHQVAVDAGLDSGYPHLRQYVFTSHPDDLPAEKGLTALDTDPAALVRGFKEEDSPLDIWMCGGGALAATLIDEIDEFRLKVNPVIAGTGIPLLGPGPGLPLELTQRLRRDFDSGVSYVEYTRD